MCKKPLKYEKFNPQEHLRKERENILSKVEQQHSEMMELVDVMIDGWTGKGTQDVKKKDMMEFPVMEWSEIDTGVWIRRRLDIYDIIVFDTIVLEGSKFGLHKHSDCDEVCDMVRGGFVDLLDGKETLKYELCYNKKGKYHHLKAIKGEKLMNLKSIGLPFDECIGTELRVYFK